MDSFDAFQDKEFEQLNDAILKAIVSSRDVEKVLQDFKSKYLINEVAVLNLILSLEELSGLIFSESPNKKIQTIHVPHVATSGLTGYWFVLSCNCGRVVESICTDAATKYA